MPRKQRHAEAPAATRPRRAAISLVFVARGKAFAGVYLYDVSSATLYEVATSDDLIEGRRPTDLEVGSRPLVGERCTFTARFKGGGEVTGGVYLATLRPAPAQALRRK